MTLLLDAIIFTSLGMILHALIADITEPKQQIRAIHYSNLRRHK